MVSLVVAIFAAETAGGRPAVGLAVGGVRGEGAAERQSRRRPLPVGRGLKKQGAPRWASPFSVRATGGDRGGGGEGRRRRSGLRADAGFPHTRHDQSLGAGWPPSALAIP